MSAHVPGCTGKAKYGTEATAVEVDRNRRRRDSTEWNPTHAYQCPACGCWHLSKQTPAQHARSMRKLERRSIKARGLG